MVVVNNSFVGSIVSTSITGRAARTAHTHKCSVFCVVIGVNTFAKGAIVSPLQGVVNSRTCVCVGCFSKFVALVTLLTIFFLCGSARAMKRKGDVHRVKRNFLHVIAG